MKAPKTILIALSMTLTTFVAHADERASAVSASTAGVAASGSMALSRPLPDFPVAATRWTPASRQAEFPRGKQEQGSGTDLGRVVLSYEVAADGTVRDVQVVSATPPHVFTRSAVSAVEKWRYVPGTTDRRVVEFTFVRD